MSACAKCPRSERNCYGPCACLEDGRDITLHVAEGYCPLGRFGTDAKPVGWDERPAAANVAAPKATVRGLGDVVAKVTTALGVTPCGGCKQRQEALNKLVPFKPPTL